MTAIYRRSNCRGCGAGDLDMVLKLRPSPIGDAFVTKKILDESQELYPIDLFFCKKCNLAQLLDVVNEDLLYKDYLYVTSSSSGLNQHFKDYVADINLYCPIVQDSLVIDIGSNDGTLLKHFKNTGANVLGVEPASHIADEARRSGVRTENVFFSSKVAQDLLERYGSAKIITANNVFANIDDLSDWINGIKLLLDNDGVFVFESFYLLDLIENMVFDFIYHEHLSAFSVTSVKSIFEIYGLELVRVQRIATKGGSLRYFIQRKSGPLKVDQSVQKLAEFEAKKFSDYVELFNKYQQDIDKLKYDTIEFLKNAKSLGKKIAGFGASITGTTLIYHFEIGQYIDFLLDDNPAKQGKYSPGLHIPVLSMSALEEQSPEIVVLLAWRYANNFIEKNISYFEKGGKAILPIPEFKVIGFEEIQSVKR